MVSAMHGPFPRSHIKNFVRGRFFLPTSLPHCLPFHLVHRAEALSSARKHIPHGERLSLASPQGLPIRTRVLLGSRLM